MSTLRIRPKDWAEFQHYKDRSPPWIRLHRKLLDNFDYHRLPDASKALATYLWLLAAESSDVKTGEIDARPDALAFRLRMDGQKALIALKPLISSGFFVVIEDASNLLAQCKQHAVPETETETETEERQNIARQVERDRFPEFWDAYGKKVGKQESQKLWKSKKLNALADTILADIAKRRVADRKWIEGFQMDPERYLRNERWADAIQAPINGQVAHEQRCDDVAAQWLEGFHE